MIIAGPDMLHAKPEILRGDGACLLPLRQKPLACSGGKGQGECLTIQVHQPHNCRIGYRGLRILHRETTAVQRLPAPHHFDQGISGQWAAGCRPLESGRAFRCDPGWQAQQQPIVKLTGSRVGCQFLNEDSYRSQVIRRHGNHPSTDKQQTDDQEQQLAGQNMGERHTGHLVGPILLPQHLSPLLPQHLSLLTTSSTDRTAACLHGPQWATADSWLKRAVRKYRQASRRNNRPLHMASHGRSSMMCNSAQEVMAR